LATAVLVLLGVGYILRDSIPAEIRRLMSGSREAAPALQTARPSPDLKQPRATRRLRGGATGSAELAALNEPVSTAVINVQVPPFPEAAAILPGMSKAEVVRRFGPPNWKVTWTDSRTLNEKYAYMDHQRVTELLIQAGRVVSRQTGAASNRLSVSRVSIDWE
jgi:hypothetical protein